MSEFPKKVESLKNNATDTFTSLNRVFEARSYLSVRGPAEGPTMYPVFRQFPPGTPCSLAYLEKQQTSFEFIALIHYMCISVKLETASEICYGSKV